MFKALGRLFKAFVYFIVGKTDRASDIFYGRETVVRAVYDENIRNRADRMKQLKNAIERQLAQKKKHQKRQAELLDEVAENQEIMKGAQAIAQDRVQDLLATGQTQEQIESDPEYKDCIAEFNNAETTLTEQKNELELLQETIQSFTESIEDNKLILKDMMRENEKLKGKKEQQVAKLISAKEQQAIYDMVSGISLDDDNEALKRVDEKVEQVVAGAEISSELAGVDQKKSRARFKDAARTRAANTKFTEAMGFPVAKKEAQATQTAPSQTEIPES